MSDANPPQLMTGPQIRMAAHKLVAMWITRLDVTEWAGQVVGLGMTDDDIALLRIEVSKLALEHRQHGGTK